MKKNSFTKTHRGKMKPRGLVTCQGAAYSTSIGITRLITAKLYEQQSLSDSSALTCKHSVQVDSKFKELYLTFYRHFLYGCEHFAIKRMTFYLYFLKMATLIFPTGRLFTKLKINDLIQSFVQSTEINNSQNNGT